MNASHTETATLAGGCFWCLEAVFDELQGVADVVSGYMGGQNANPSYEQVCRGNTGHAEVVQLRFDSAVTTFDEVLGVFFSIHDPTTLNRQGNDAGTQYRSAIFYHSDAQRQTAQRTIAALDTEKIWDGKIVTEVVEAGVFYPAEDYHQEYFKRNPHTGYCAAVVSPKVSKFRKKFVAKLKK